MLHSGLILYANISWAYVWVGITVPPAAKQSFNFSAVLKFINISIWDSPTAGRCTNNSTFSVGRWPAVLGTYLPLRHTPLDEKTGFNPKKSTSRCAIWNSRINIECPSPQHLASERPRKEQWMHIFCRTCIIESFSWKSMLLNFLNIFFTGLSKLSFSPEWMDNQNAMVPNNWRRCTLELNKGTQTQSWVIFYSPLRI